MMVYSREILVSGCYKRIGVYRILKLLKVPVAAGMQALRDCSTP